MSWRAAGKDNPRAIKRFVKFFLLLARPEGGQQELWRYLSPSAGDIFRGASHI